MLENGGHPVAPGLDVPEGRRPLTLEEHLAPVGPVDPGHYRYESGLACPVAAHEAQAAAGAKGQADPTKGQCAAELLVDTDGLGGRDAVRRNGSFRIFSHRFLPSAYIANWRRCAPHPG